MCAWLPQKEAAARPVPPAHLSRSLGRDREAGSAAHGGGHVGGACGRRISDTWCLEGEGGGAPLPLGILKVVLKYHSCSGPLFQGMPRGPVPRQLPRYPGNSLSYLGDRSLLPGALGLALPWPGIQCHWRPRFPLERTVHPGKKGWLPLAASGSLREQRLPAPPPKRLFLIQPGQECGCQARGQGAILGSLLPGGERLATSLSSPRLWPAGRPWPWLLSASPPNSPLSAPSPPPAKEKACSRGPRG